MRAECGLLAEMVTGQLGIDAMHWRSSLAQQLHVQVASRSDPALAVVQITYTGGFTIV